MFVVASKNAIVGLVVVTLFMISLAAAQPDNCEDPKNPPCCLQACRVGLPLLLLFLSLFFLSFAALALISDFRRQRMHQGAKHVLHGARIEMAIQIVVATSLAFPATKALTNRQRAYSYNTHMLENSNMKLT